MTTDTIEWTRHPEGFAGQAPSGLIYTLEPARVDGRDGWLVGQDGAVARVAFSRTQAELSVGALDALHRLLTEDPDLLSDADLARAAAAARYDVRRMTAEGADDAALCDARRGLARAERAAARRGMPLYA